MNVQTRMVPCDKEITFLVCSNRADGTLRSTLNTIARQSNPELWECVLVDNGFTDAEGAKLWKDCRGHFSQGCFKMACEPNSGLGYARRTGFRTASGRWIVMLDDDNYLDDTYVSILADTLRAYPSVGGITPLVVPLFRGAPHPWKGYVANRCLSVTESALKQLDMLPKYFSGEVAREAPRPPGGGMVLRREIAMRWIDVAERRSSLYLERTGNCLIAAGDEEIWRTLLAEKWPIVVSDQLRVEHDLPEKRFGWCYLWRLNYWMAWSYAQLDKVDGLLPEGSRQQFQWVQSLRHIKLLVLASDKEERMGRWMDWAAALGRNLAMKQGRRGEPGGG